MSRNQEYFLVVNFWENHSMIIYYLVMIRDAKFDNMNFHFASCSQAIIWFPHIQISWVWDIVLAANAYNKINWSYSAFFAPIRRTTTSDWRISMRNDKGASFKIASVRIFCINFALSWFLNLLYLHFADNIDKERATRYTQVFRQCILVISGCLRNLCSVQCFCSSNYQCIGNTNIDGFRFHRLCVSLISFHCTCRCVITTKLSPR